MIVYMLVMFAIGWAAGWMTASMLVRRERVAEFFEPIMYNWDEDVHIARMAARKYSESTRAKE